MKPFALEGEFQLALCQGLLGSLVAFRLPIAAVPELDRATAILAFRDGPFEVAVVERMIFDLDRESFILRIERWTLVTAQVETPSSSRRRS